MIGRISVKAAEALCKAINSKENYELYEYTIYITLSSIFHFITVAILGVCFGLFVESIIFYSSFIVVRKFAGGYHAKTPTRCFLVSLMINIAVLFAIKLLSGYSGWITDIICIVSFLIILLFSPVEHKNKPLNEREIKIYKRIAVTAAFILMTLFFLLKYFGLFNLANPICFGIFGSSFVVLLEQLHKIKER